MVSPLITPASVTVLNGGGTTTGTLFVPLSAPGNDRVLAIVGFVKDNSTTAADVSTITVDSAGVNRTIGSGVTLQGSRQLAQESSFSSQCVVYFCLEPDLPTSAATYNVDIAMDSATQYNMWLCFEVTGCPKQAYDAIVQNLSTVDVSAGTPFSDSITPVDDDCLIVDMWTTSHSAQPTYTTSQTFLAQARNTNGAFIASQFTQVGAATAKTMTEESSTLHQRRAWNLISFSGVATSGVNYSRTLSDTLAVTDIEERVLNLTRFLNSNTDVTDQLIIGSLFYRVLSSDIDITDLLTKDTISTAIISRILSSTINVNDTVLSYLDLSRLVASEISINDSTVTQELINRLLSSDVLINDAVSRIILAQNLVDRVLSDNVNINDSQYAYKLLNRTLSDVFYLSDSIVRTLIESGVVVIERNLSDNVVIIDSITRNLLISRLLSENITLNDAIIKEILGVFVELILTSVSEKNINISSSLKNIVIDSKDI